MSSSCKKTSFQAVGCYAISIAASLGVGYFFGTRYGSSVRPTPSVDAHPSPEPQVQQDVIPKIVESEDSEDDEDEHDTVADGDLSAITAGFNEQCKLILVVRTDLKMTPGKIAAQCGHATLACYKALIKKNPKLIQHWERTGQAKIALKATSEEQMLELEAIAKSLNLCARSIQDAGRTQVEAGSRTVLGIGPAPVGLVNQVTGHLRLL